jgi:hypothetical protein
VDSAVFPAADAQAAPTLADTRKRTNFVAFRAAMGQKILKPLA